MAAAGAGDYTGHSPSKLKCAMVIPLLVIPLLVLVIPLLVIPLLVFQYYLIYDI